MVMEMFVEGNGETPESVLWTAALDRDSACITDD